METSDKPWVALLSFINKIIPNVEFLIGNVVENVHIFSDDMPSQFRSRFVSFWPKLNVEWKISYSIAKNVIMEWAQWMVLREQ